MDRETRAAIVRACVYIKEDRRVLNLVCAPHEGVTVKDVAKIRSTLADRAELFPSSETRRYSDIGELSVGERYEMRQHASRIASSTKALGERLAQFHVHQ